MAKKHFIIYYKQGTGTYVVTEPRPWSRENQQHFQGFDFIDNHPITDIIEDYLINNHNFIRDENENENVTVIYNLDPNLIL